MSKHVPDQIHQSKDWEHEIKSCDDMPVADADTVVSGRTIAQWTESWWKWALQAPNGAGPLDNAAYQSSDQGKMVFIAGNYSATVHAAAQKPILFPMINAFDSEGPGIASIPNFVADHRGSYYDEARYITNLEQHSIYDAYAKLTEYAGTGHARTIFDVHLSGAEASGASVKSSIFAVGLPKSGSFIENLLGSNGLLPLDPSIKNLPFTRSTGDWIEMKGLKPGTYTLEFGGKGHAVVDPVANYKLFDEGWGPSVTDTLIVS